MSGASHLEDALMVLGIPVTGSWVGFVDGDFGENNGLDGVVCVYTAWQI